MLDETRFLAWDVLVFIIRRECDKYAGINSLMPTPGTWKYRVYYLIGKELLQVRGFKYKSLVSNDDRLPFIGMRLLGHILKYVTWVVIFLERDKYGNRTPRSSYYRRFYRKSSQSADTEHFFAPDDVLPMTLKDRISC